MLLEALDALLHSDEIRTAIRPIVGRVSDELTHKPMANMAWEPIPLAIYNGALPPTIQSSWVFVLRAGVTTGAERHPNSHQRLISFEGSGDMQTGGEGKWSSNILISEQDALLERKWISISAKVWHQVVVPDGADWAVVSFHTVPAEELIEERPDPAHTSPTQQRRYLAAEEKKV